MNATIQYHLDKYQCEVAKNLKNSLYSDNLVSGADNEAEAHDFHKRAVNIFKKAGMNLKEVGKAIQHHLNKYSTMIVMLRNYLV